jgi:hypothetical protein
MIGPPFNDEDCLEPITEIARNLAASDDPQIVALAQQFPNTDAFAQHLRSLPQRDDLGDPADGPKVTACRPPQRLRIASKNPNCVERGTDYIIVSEKIDPGPVRQLVTIETPWGMHTMPLENGVPVILDPQLPRNAACGALFAAYPATFPISVSDAVDFVATVAAAPAHAAGTLQRVRDGQRAMQSMAARYIVSDRDLEDASYTAELALATAHQWGPRAPGLINKTINELRERMPRQVGIAGPSPGAVPMCGQHETSAYDYAHRNLSLSIGGRTLRPDTAVLGALAKIGVRVGATAAVPLVMAKLGIPLAALGVIEGELNREGMSLGSVLGSVAKPMFPSLGTIPKDRSSETRNAMATIPLGQLLDTRNIATPAETLTEMRTTDGYIDALDRDITTAFRRPFERQKAEAEARFQRETGRPPRSADDARIYATMSPAPAPVDIEWMTYQGGFVVGWAEFYRAWKQFFADRDGFFSRLPGSGAHAQSLDFRSQAKDWRARFEALGGIASTPAPTDPVTPPDTFDRVSDRVGRAAKAGLIAAGVIVAGAVILPPLLRRSPPAT